MRLFFPAAAIALAVAATACGGSGAASSSKPALTVVRASLRGAHFVSRERVLVTFSVAGRHTTRDARASSTGRFAVRLSRRDPCLGDVAIVARGSSGDVARLKLPQRACPPALQPGGSS
jgi:hypothetical protein